MGDPELIMIDEPTEGLSPVVVPSIIESLAKIRAFGHSVCIAESNIHHVPEFTDRLFVVFQRLHGRNDYPGNGIGLAICRNVCPAGRSVPKAW